MRIAIVGGLTIALAIPGMAVAGSGLTARRNANQRVAPARQTAALSTKALTQIYTKDELEEGVYVGSEYCIACHQSQQGWRNTKHAHSLRSAEVEYSLITGQGVTADYDRNGVDDFIQGLDFNQIPSGFDPFKPNAPILSVVDGQYLITIGEITYPVIFINGGAGEWRERYAVRVPVTDSPSGYSDDVYFPPLQYDNAPNHWIPYKTQLWWTPDNQPKIVPGMTRAEVASILKPTFSKNCIGCHTTGIRNLGKTTEGEWQFTPYVATLYRADDPHYFDYDGDGNKDLVNIGCEMCHGPGSKHILGGGDPSEIVNPAKLSVDQANEVCGRCHNRQRSVPNKTYGWPYHDDTNSQWTPGGEPLSDYYVDANELWPDEETSYEHNQHYAEIYRSAHETGDGDHLRCTTCHSPHSAQAEHQIRGKLVVDGVTVKTATDDNTLCLACHAGSEPFDSLSTEQVAHPIVNRDAIASGVSSHSNHPYGPERSMGLSRCTECHMPSVANAQRASDHRSHTMFVVPPEKTIVYAGDAEGMVNACAVSCHSQKVNVWGLGIDPDMQVWNETFDLDNAAVLEQYYGPSGIWWQKTVAGGEPAN